ncbi:MAG: biotin--[acetyl-CoA-carboxylase] ligase [Lachnospiraceae bacterium]|nr:biotin--[acetyl-CoA-carboxylase] ligase [Lachnospiraceae bacterium]
MSTKEKVYDILKESGSNFISGEEIANRIYVTRAAVWKAIKSLEKEDIKIEAITNKGYRLMETEKIINKAAIFNEINTEYAEFEYLKDIHIEAFQTVGSTNDLAREYANNGEKEAVFIADCQTKGRGRKGRDFYSPTSTGLYMSFLLFPHTDFAHATNYTCMAAECICRAIKKVTGIDTKIKWVNDIYYNDKKIAGILTEGIASLEDGRLSHVIIGAGINIYTPYDGFPDDIKKKAGALLANNVDSEVRDRLAGAIIGEFYKSYKEPDKYPFFEGYKEKSMLVGNYVKILPYGDSKEKNDYALVTGIDDECRLLIKYEDGRTDALSSGEVSVVKY